MNIEKNNIKELEKNVDYLLKSKIQIDKVIVYEILNKVYENNFSIVKKVEQYLNSNECEYDSVLFSFITLSYLKHDGFLKAFKLLTKCCSIGMQPLSNVIIQLYSKLLEDTTVENLQKKEYKNFLDVQVKLFYNYDPYSPIFKKLNEEFSKNEIFRDDKKKFRKKRSLNDILAEKMSGEKLFAMNIDDGKYMKKRIKKESYNENDKDPSK